MDDIKARLDELADIQAAVDVARLDYEAKRSAILAAVQAELDALDAEYEPLFDASQQRTEMLLQSAAARGLDLEGMVALIPAAVKAELPTTEANIATALHIDDAFWLENIDRLTQRFNAWAAR